MFWQNTVIVMKQGHSITNDKKLISGTAPFSRCSQRQTLPQRFFFFFFLRENLSNTVLLLNHYLKNRFEKKNLVITLKEYCWLCYSVSKSILLGCSWKDQVIINKLSCKLNDKAISVFFLIWHRSLLFLVSRFCQVREKLAVIFQVCICQLISYPRS